MVLFRISRLVLAQHVSLIVCSLSVILLFIQTSSPEILITLPIIIIAQVLGIVDQMRSHYYQRSPLKNTTKASPTALKLFSFNKLCQFFSKKTSDQTAFDNLTMAIFSLSKNKTLTPLNRYASFLFKHFNLVNQQDSIAQAVNSIKPGENTLLSIPTCQTTLPILTTLIPPPSVHIDSSPATEHKVISIVPIPAQLKKVQQDTSLQLLRFIKHELINITTPISSLSEVLVILIHKLPTTPKPITDDVTLQNTSTLQDILLAADTIQKSTTQLKTFTKNLNSQDFLDKFMSTTKQ
ncbi:hypothetical protein [Zooshikella harenae]|uniref:Uncharacterized protein n=1 Tax=Zooshikella harenae TaxID=2827238 RepID=A0ABS5Z8Z3_9GAMM|nr:hypothetical protein [Zooshikella harenae]MBU2710455.1 hypothetical protein [Zooshikella harenae]